MSARKFAEGDRVIISSTPVDGSDKKYSGKVGNIESYTHKNGDLEVYRVLLDGDDYAHAFYDSDLLPYGELQSLRVELAQAEDRVARLKEALRAKERNASDLPLATVVSYKDTYGPAAITKQAENSWLNIFPSQSGIPNTEILPDSRVTQLLTNNVNAIVRKP